MQSTSKVWQFYGTLLFVWLSAVFSMPLMWHLYFVLWSPKALGDGQYVMVFPFAVALGFLVGLFPAGLTVFLMLRKPRFERVAFWVALGHGAFWAITVTLSEALFVGINWLGGGVILALAFLSLDLPVTVFFILWVVEEPIAVAIGILALLPFAIALLIAFWLTPSHGWTQESIDSQNDFGAANSR